MEGMMLDSLDAIIIVNQSFSNKIKINILKIMAYLVSLYLSDLMNITLHSIGLAKTIQCIFLHIFWALLYLDSFLFSVIGLSDHQS